MSNEAQDPVPWVKHEVFSSNSNSKLVSDPPEWGVAEGGFTAVRGVDSRWNCVFSLGRD